MSTIPEELPSATEPASRVTLSSPQPPPPARPTLDPVQAIQHGGTVLAGSSHPPPALNGGWGDTLVKKDLQTIRSGPQPLI